jgi:uncharacterized protein YhdP
VGNGKLETKGKRSGKGSRNGCLNIPTAEMAMTYDVLFRTMHKCNKNQLFFQWLKGDQARLFN